MSQHFHFTIGPVQSFVEQARRTRDFWAGSFILSFLSAVAMKAVQQQDGRITFPAPDPEFIKCLTQGNKAKFSPTQGSVPNRFKAKIEEGFVAKRIAETVREAWHQLAEELWKRDLAALGEESESRRIWNRQVKSFWEIYWAVAPDDQHSDLIDRRKNWRNHLAPDEPGAKCLVMDGWQELSGIQGEGKDDRDRRKEFWKSIAQSCNTTDFREGEQLCAMAFVKRRFARHFKCLKAEMPGGWMLRGWKLPTAVPSVAYLAAVPWIEQIVSQKIDPSAVETFTLAAREVTGNYGEWKIDLECLRQAGKTSGAPAHFFRSLDGSLFFKETLLNPNLFKDVPEETKKHAREALEVLRDQARAKDIAHPSPYYSILRMDGDALGKQMSIVDRQEPISKALGKFTGQVKKIVDAQSGFLIYAGGDDVLAMLSLDQAMPCARKLRDHYEACFASKVDAVGKPVRSTLSGAIEYAHFRVPLSRVLSNSHHLLDNVAKDGCGRDSLAVRVWAPGGQLMAWAMPWEAALDEPVEGKDQRLVLEALVDELRSPSGNESGRPKQPEESVFSSRFFYRIRELFALLNPRHTDQEHLTSEQALKLMTAEYISSGVHGEKRPTTDQVQPTVERLLRQCRPQIRHVNNDPPKDDVTFEITDQLQADGALLVRFLARKGVEA